MGETYFLTFYKGSSDKTIASISTALTANRDNHVVADIAAVKELMHSNGARFISFSFFEFPRRPVDIDKADKWLRKLFAFLRERADNGL